MAQGGIGGGKGAPEFALELEVLEKRDVPRTSPRNARHRRARAAPWTGCAGSRASWPPPPVPYVRSGAK